MALTQSQSQSQGSLPPGQSSLATVDELESEKKFLSQVNTKKKSKQIRQRCSQSFGDLRQVKPYKGHEDKEGNEEGTSNSYIQLPELSFTRHGKRDK